MIFLGMPRFCINAAALAPLTQCILMAIYRLMPLFLRSYSMCNVLIPLNICHGLALSVLNRDDQSVFKIDCYLSYSGNWDKNKAI